MSTEEAKNLQDKKGLWADISSDEEDSQPQKQQSDHEEQKPQTTAEKQPEQQTEANNRNQKQQPRIKSFDPKKHLRGGFGNMKTVKGGFKPEKLQKKKFHLDAVRNPFDLGDEQSEEEEQTQQQQTQPAVEEPAAKQQQQKKQQKPKKKKNELAELEETLKEFGLTEAAEGDKKKKRAKKVKKTGQQTAQQQPAAETKPADQPEQPAAEDFSVDKQKLQEIIKQKAKKPEPKKSGKPNVASAALKAKEERQAKNKQKKVYVDL